MARVGIVVHSFPFLIMAEEILAGSADVILESAKAASFMIRIIITNVASRRPIGSWRRKEQIFATILSRLAHLRHLQTQLGTLRELLQRPFSRRSKSPPRDVLMFNSSVRS
jgi:hypothetical protein